MSSDRVEHREGGDLRIRFEDSDGETIWTRLYQRGFWDLRTQKGEIRAGGNAAGEEAVDQ